MRPTGAKTKQYRTPWLQAFRIPHSTHHSARAFRTFHSAFYFPHSTFHISAFYRYPGKSPGKSRSITFITFFLRFHGQFGFGKTKSKVQVGPLLDNNGVLLDSEKDKTSSLNNYFAAVFTSEDTINWHSYSHSYDLEWLYCSFARCTF